MQTASLLHTRPVGETIFEYHDYIPIARRSDGISAVGGRRVFAHAAWRCSTFSWTIPDANVPYHRLSVV